ncbi:unnamed protein product [Coffea canephora]|uniref:DH200=94 genomic scaffold, scaffold_133 n=1 Tax=Coffea canephora TaxID=49390 RepID=A0A068VGZ9_COFCA|nr:unnamed protein product [Coffea canephora]CDP11595.1 unnamed protein product [Coffea canephora]CDP12431.1 unnamed protein product [Coffea canephora]CDP16591.1 unnamed protein product [Coffea canephora]CDP17954.1 unnamed protein product [Coffea canephora]
MEGLKPLVSFKLENSRFNKQYLKNHISLSTSPKLENLVLLESSFKVLKVLRRHFSTNVSERHSNFGSKLVT